MNSSPRNYLAADILISFIFDQNKHSVILSQLAVFKNLQRAVIDPSATLKSRSRPAIDLCRMLTGM